MTQSIETVSGELLNCPFCGSDDLIVMDDDSGDYRQHFEMWVECCACDARSSQIKYLASTEAEVKNSAIAAWNRRTLSPAHGEAVADEAWKAKAYALVESIWIDQDGVRRKTALTDAWVGITEMNADEIIEFAKLYAALSPASLPLGVKGLTGDLRDGWLIHKAGRGWYRPNAQGYTNDPAQAGRYTREDADAYSHPNGLDGPRDEITIRHESDLPALKPIEPERISEAWLDIATAPKDGTDVILWLGAGMTIGHWFAPWSCWMRRGDDPETDAEVQSGERYGIGSRVPTCWQALPTPPAALNGAV